MEDDLKELRDVITKYLDKGISPELIGSTVKEMVKGHGEDKKEDKEADEDEDKKYAEKAFGVDFAE